MGTALLRAQQRQRRGRLLLAGLAASAAGLSVASLAFGAIRIPVAQLVAILIGGDAPRHLHSIVLDIRLPRTLLGIMVGAGLGVCGAAVQGLFRNPLAEPGLLGVSTGAALGAAVVLVLGGAGWMLPPVAFLAGLAATIVVYRVSTVRGHTVVATMLLAGIAVNALAAAGTGLLIFLADDAQLRELTFWTLGGLGGADWKTLASSAPFVGVALIALPRLAMPLNALLLGEREAAHLGMNVARVERWVILLSACAVGACVAASGVIGFVGLVVPHLLRLMIGPDHRLVLPGSIFLGAALLLAADLLARQVVAPAELPIGILTAIAGAPFFLALLLRDRNRRLAAC